MITVPCSTPTYQKANGDYYCAFAIRDVLNWFQADDACQSKGGRLPEIYTLKENMDILKLKVK
jgi:hypothetical protein